MLSLSTAQQINVHSVQLKVADSKFNETDLVVFVVNIWGLQFRYDHISFIHLN